MLRSIPREYMYLVILHVFDMYLKCIFLDMYPKGVKYTFGIHVKSLKYMYPGRFLGNNLGVTV